MAQTATNVSTGKPAVGGAVYIAPASTASSSLPTDATTALNAAFVSLGYCSDDGLSNSNTPESDTVKAWGGDTVLTLFTSKEDTFTFKLLEVLNDDVLKAVYGSGKVTGSLSAGLTVSATSEMPESHVWVFDMIMTNNVKKRILIPDGRLSDLAEINYRDDEASGYEITITALPDTSGVTHKEFIKAPTTSGSGG